MPPYTNSVENLTRIFLMWIDYLFLELVLVLNFEAALKEKIVTWSWNIRTVENGPQKNMYEHWKICRP